MTFSERMGIVERSTLLQRDSMNSELRNSLWNVLDQEVWNSNGFLYRQHGRAHIDDFSQAVWFHYFKRPADERPDRTHRILEEIRGYFFNAPWNEVYDFLEFVLIACSEDRFRNLRWLLNSILRRELSGYRIIEDKFVPITDQYEIEEISEAIADSPYAGARTHLRQALEHMSNREAPDYRNSIKEAISAVESAAREITGNPQATLGDALREIEKSVKIHGALRTGFSALYGYTSDADGIRHGMVDVANLTVADAKYFLVACAAFVNYLVAKHAAAT